MGAMSLNLSSNNLGELVLPRGWFYDEDDKIYYGPKDEEHGEPPEYSEPEGIIAIANAIKGTTTKLDVSSNNLCAKGGGHLAAALKGTLVMRELNISSNCLSQRYQSCAGDSNDKPDMSGVIAVADAISNMPALSKLIFGGDAYEDTSRVAPGPATLEIGMTEADLSNKNLGVGGAVIILAAWIIHKGDWAITSLNVKDNQIGVEGKRSLGKAIQKSNVQFFVCDEWSITQDTTEVDVGSKNLQLADVILLGGIISNNGALTVLSLKGNGLGTKEAGKVLGEMLKKNSVLKELDLSENGAYRGDSAGFAQELALGLKDNHALLSANLLKNDIGIGEARALASILKEHSTLKSLCGNTGNETELDMSAKRLGAAGIIMLAPEIADNGTLSSLNLTKNSMQGVEAGKALGDALAVNTVLKELDLSGTSVDGTFSAQPNMDTAFLVAFAPGLSNNGALLKLLLEDNKLATKEAGKTLAEALAGNSALKELDVSSNNWRQGEGEYSPWQGDGPGFAQELTVGLRDNGALLVLSLNSNSLGPGGGKTLAEGLRGNSVIEELNIADNELTDSGTDMSGVVAIANAIPGMGAMTKFDISNNMLGAAGGKALAVGLKDNQIITELNIATNYFGLDMNTAEADTSGVIAIADAINDMGGATKLDVRKNCINDEGKRALHQAAGSRYCNSISCRFVQLSQLTLIDPRLPRAGSNFNSTTTKTRSLASSAIAALPTRSARVGNRDPFGRAAVLRNLKASLGALPQPKERRGLLHWGGLNETPLPIWPPECEVWTPCPACVRSL
jgi:hypothetical protein